MKKFMSILILFAMLLSLCACGAEESAQATTGATEATQAATDPTEETKGENSHIHELTNEDLYGHINQLEPMNGVYQIWSDVGVKNMADHPDAEFELLCNVDMQGATLKPIGTAEKPFTGKLRGSDFAISNFTVQGGDEESFGFIGVNQGEIRNLILEDVTFVPGENAKYIGTLAGINENLVIRCTVNSSAMTVENAPEGAVCGGVVGLNKASLTNTKTTVDLAYNAQNAATVGGVVGIAQGGEVSKVELSGKFEVAGDNKTVGLFAGTTDVVIADCVFLGEKNTVNGQLCENFTGDEDDEMITVTGALLRDNGREELPENVRAVRNKVVKAMYDMGTIQWKVREDLAYSDRSWPAAYQLLGIPYNAKNSSLAQAEYMIGDDGYIEDWVYDMPPYDSWDMYFGSNCHGAVQTAWWSVSNSTDTFVVRYMHQQAGFGGIAVGPYDWTIPIDMSDPQTYPFIEGNDEQTIYESYAAMRAGDAYGYHKPTGGHVRMAAEDPVVVRDQNGLIDPQRSYVISHEQGYAMRDEEARTYTSWRINFKYYFSNLYFDWAVPITCEELITGEMEPVEAYLENAVEGYAGMFSGTVRTNYHLDSVTLHITDAMGNTVFQRPFFVDVQKANEYSNNYYAGRVYNNSCELSNLALFVSQAALQPGESYSYTITAGLATFDNIVVHEGSFVYGS